MAVAVRQATEALKVLCIEDEPQIRKFLRISLTNSGYMFHEAASGQEGLEKSSDCLPDLIILDLGLPDMDGIEVIARLRQVMQTPIIILSVRGSEQDKIALLDAGADDYVIKPFGMGELLARMRVALRRASGVGAGEQAFSMGSAVIDLANRKVTVGDKPVHLTPIEYKLLSMLIRHCGKVLTHSQLLKEVWGDTYATESHYLRVYMSQLRQKLEIDPARPQYLLTEAGVGYRLVSSGD